MKQQFESTGKKLRLDNHQRRNLAKRGKAMCWAQLQKYATLVRPEIIFFSEKSLRRAVEQYIEHFHHERNHQGIDNLIPFPNSPQVQSQSGLIVKSERLGGLLNYYHNEEKEEGEAA